MLTFNDMLGFEIIRVEGYSCSCSHDSIHRIFSFVDKEARKALKLCMKGFQVEGLQPDINEA